ncbi:hypothetical protein FG87_31155 [Nocardia vulneris]|uniref:Uncharacterized protein n=1 Tax=Nocardia vulneris TaxID=1141657 RepID=A0ABR4Z7V6_9NOCA|nr:hypothetical protein FG87_31155 [Nocardia vulneris]
MDASLIRIDVRNETMREVFGVGDAIGQVVERCDMRLPDARLLLVPNSSISVATQRRHRCSMTEAVSAR